MGWAAIAGEMSLYHTLPLYISGVCWTLVYDTLYGYQDRKDDARLGNARAYMQRYHCDNIRYYVGLKSTSLYLGESPRMPLTVITSGMIGGLVITGCTSGLAYPYYILVGAAGSHLLWQIWSADLNDAKNLWYRFDSNKYIGAVIAAAIITGKVMA